jgi:hypothetical protein
VYTALVDTPIVLSTLPTTLANRYLALYNFWLAIETACENQLTARASGAAVNSYSFNGGQGTQSTSRMSLDELAKMITYAEGMARHYAQKIWGRGLMNHMLRRR